MEAYLRLNKPARSQFRSPRRNGTKPSGLTVVHTAEGVMDTVGVDTGAENIARFIQNRSEPGSYHDIVDSDSSIKLVRYSDEAFQDGTGSNPFAMSISFACKTTDWSKMSRTTREGFLRQGALAFARQQDWLRRYQHPTTPLYRISRTASTEGHAGFISHGERDPGRRSDPGADFPWNEFFAACKAAVSTSSAPAALEDSPMLYVAQDSNGLWYLTDFLTNKRRIARESTVDWLGSNVAKKLSGQHPLLLDPLPNGPEIS